ncbi:hypothetical protein RJ641_010967, partial [Dillenia turbinata]
DMILHLSKCKAENTLDMRSLYHLFVAIVTAVSFQAYGSASVAVPSSTCYALDNSSHIFDFSSWLGHKFEYENYDGKVDNILHSSNSDLVVRFCKDVEIRSQKGYINFGRFEHVKDFVTGSGHIDFTQGYYYGDLRQCEHSYDKMGRTAQVNVICGACSNGRCRGEIGCICNISYESTCRIVVDLAIPCEKQGPRVFEGFTVGFHPRSWEVVYNGMTQSGFQIAQREFSFRTEHTHVALYMTSVASLSGLVKKPIVEVVPANGLQVSLSGSGATGRPPTTLEPTVLILEWRCEKARDAPYEVNITIPIDGYHPAQFYLTKMCEYQQDDDGVSTRGWATFGVLSFISLVLSTLFCCGGVTYKTRVQHRRGIEALPGYSFLSACLETVSGDGGRGYTQVDGNSAFVNQTSWPQQHIPAQGTQRTQGVQRTSGRNYGAF